MVYELRDNAVPFPLFNHRADPPVRHDDDFALEKAYKDHDARPLPGVKDFLFEKCTFSALAGTLLQVGARGQPAPGTGPEPGNQCTKRTAGNDNDEDEKWIVIKGEGGTVEDVAVEDHHEHKKENT